MRKKLPAALIVGATLMFIAHALYLRCVAEDAFISFRFARNLAAGDGFVWNVGEQPVEGFTNFLWVVLCAVAVKAGLDVVVFAQVAGLLAGVAAIAGVYCFAVKNMGISRGGAIAACFLLASFGPFATWATSGMETVPFALCVLAGTYSMLRFLDRQRVYHGVMGALALLAAALLRPEGAMVAGVVCGLCWLLWSSRSGRSRWNALTPPTLFGALFVTYFVWRYRHFGFLLPNTFYAKTGGGLPQQIRGVRYTVDFVAFYVLPMLPIAVLAAWEYMAQGRSHLRIGPAENVAGDPIRRWDPRENFLVRFFASISHLRSVAVVCAALLIVYAAYIVYVGGDYMAMYRFWVPLVPFIALVFGRMVCVVFAGEGRSAGRKAIAYATVGLTCVLSLWPSTPVEAITLRKPKYHHGRFQGVYRERWHTSRLTAIGKFFQQRRNDYSETLATDAIGAIGYYSDMKILGMHGLVDTHIAHLKKGRAKLGTGFPGHEKGDLVYIFSRKPTYYMFNRTLTPKPLGWPTFGPQLDTVVRADYRLESVWLKDPGNGEEGFFTFLVRNTAPEE